VKSDLCGNEALTTFFVLKLTYWRSRKVGGSESRHVIADAIVKEPLKINYYSLRCIHTASKIVVRFIYLQSYAAIVLTKVYFTCSVNKSLKNSS
jgi:hypothetical protein